jgi:butyrate kinase
MYSRKIVVIYPEERSTFVAVYHASEMSFLKNIKHSDEDLEKFQNISEQIQFRKEAILNVLSENDIDISKVKMIMSRSGMIKPVNSGVYQINDKMIEDLHSTLNDRHPVNLGGLISKTIADDLGIKAFMADPIVVDEFDEVARMSGHPDMPRRSRFHALSHKHFARKYAKSQSKKYEDLSLIVVYVGTKGISIGAHKNAKVIDVNQSLDGDGPFGIARTGSLPSTELIRMCFSGTYTEEDMQNIILKEGGYAAYLGTSNLDEIDQRLMSGDKKAIFVSYACAYQVAKEIGSMYTVLEGNVDAIILSGYIFNSERFLENVTKRIDKIAPIALYPSKNDFEAIAMNGLRVMKKEIAVQYYK